MDIPAEERGHFWRCSMALPKAGEKRKVWLLNLEEKKLRYLTSADLIELHEEFIGKVKTKEKGDLGLLRARVWAFAQGLQAEQVQLKAGVEEGAEVEGELGTLGGQIAGASGAQAEPEGTRVEGFPGEGVSTGSASSGPEVLKDQKAVMVGGVEAWPTISLLEVGSGKAEGGSASEAVWAPGQRVTLVYRDQVHEVEILEGGAVLCAGRQYGSLLMLSVELSGAPLLGYLVLQQPEKAMRTRQPRAAKQRDPRLPAAGSVISRGYKGTTYDVDVLEDGFRCQGYAYSSLSALASELTGNPTNGFVFFRLSPGSRGDKTNTQI